MDRTDPTYDPMVEIARLRGLVRLRDGRVGRLVYWDRGSEIARVRINRTTIGVSCYQVRETLIDAAPLS